MNYGPHFRALAAALLLAGCVTPRSEPPTVPEFDPRGAVMCWWHIYASVRSIGQYCHPEDKDFIALLGDFGERIDRFILDNSDLTPAWLAARRARDERNTILNLRWDKQERGNCVQKGRHDAVGIYRFFRDRSAKLPAEVDSLLAVPRKPVWNPCV